MVKDWTTVEDAKASGFVFGIVRTPRTKERLVTAHRDAPRAAVASPEVHQLGLWATCNLRDGDVAGALDMLARAAGRLRMEDWFRGFDLRGVDEQGHLLAAGGFDTRVTAGSGDAPAPPAAGDVIEWKAGEHLDDVLERGAAAVERRARGALGKVGMRTVPDTREAFLAALGVERGRAYPGLREQIATWLDLPLTEEQSKAQAAEARAAQTRLCDSCREHREICGRCGEKSGKRPTGATMIILGGVEAPICDRCQRSLGDPSDWAIRNGRIVPKAGHDPAAVPTKNGTVVNLRDPANLRPGMVFWSPFWLNKGRVVLTTFSGTGEAGTWWNVASGGGVVPATAYSFLGMDPGVADVDPADVERFGVAAHLRVSPSGEVYDMDTMKEAADAFMASAEDRL